MNQAGQSEAPIDGSDIIYTHFAKIKDLGLAALQQGADLNEGAVLIADLGSSSGRKVAEYYAPVYGKPADDAAPEFVDTLLHPARLDEVEYVLGTVLGAIQGDWRSALREPLGPGEIRVVVIGRGTSIAEVKFTEGDS